MLFCLILKLIDIRFLLFKNPNSINFELNFLLKVLLLFFYAIFVFLLLELNLHFSLIMLLKPLLLFPFSPGKCCFNFALHFFYFIFNLNFFIKVQFPHAIEFMLNFHLFCSPHKLRLFLLANPVSFKLALP